jgi:recombination protein RecA
MPRKPSVVFEERSGDESTPHLDELNAAAKEARRLSNKHQKKTSPKKAAKKQAKNLPKQVAKKTAKKLSKLSDAFSGFRHASEALTEVRAFRTIFVGLDHATGVGGWPLERFSLVHGPSGMGKTKFIIGLMMSCLMADGFVDYVDAEATTPFPFVRSMMGPIADNERFFSTRDSEFEAIIGRVRLFCNTLIKQKSEGKIPKNTPGLIVVDSMRKLVPKDLLAQILKELKADAEESKGGKKDKGITAGKDRRAQIQAKMNAAWMDEVIPLLAKSGVAMIAIAREMEDPDADQWAKKAGWGFKIGGGGALFYDSSLVVRVERHRYVEEAKGKEEGDEFVKRKVYGERHKVTIHKTKIAGREDKKVVCFWHASNGVLVPEGFDRARDLLDLGQSFDVVTRSGSWFSYGSEKLGQGEDRAVVNLSKDEALMDRIEADVRAAFERAPPLEEEAPVRFDITTGEILE